MAGMSDYLENAIVNHVLRNTVYNSPATIYLALFTADPTDAGTLTNEVSGNAYARQPITMAAPSNGVSANSADITFPIATGSWGTITHIAICDALTAGNVLYTGQLSSSQAIAVNNQLIFKSGQLSVSVD